MNHLTTDMILAYVAGKCKEEESFSCEVHLAACSDCVRKVYSYYRLRENFDEIWDSWTVKKHSEEAVRFHVVRSLKNTRVVSNLTRRMENWIRYISKRTEAALDIMIDSTQKTAKVVQEGLGAICKPDLPLSFEMVPQPVRTRGGADRRVFSIESMVPAWVRVTIDPELNKIIVQADPQKDVLPLVALIPKREGQSSVQEFRKIEGSDYILAEFTDIPDGEYYLLLESTE